MAVASEILTQIAVRSFGSLLANVASSYAMHKDRKIKEGEDIIKRDLTDHLENTFNKCMRVKTILNDTASKTLEIYVDQRFKVNQEELDQYSMIEFIRREKSVIIIGEGGGGKSMFMRYLWLSYFEKSDGKIPFFLELRNLNTLTHSSMTDFIYHTIIKSGSTIRQNDFDQALRAGEFILFLDGFDEVNFDRRDKIQTMLIDLQDANPKLTMVVTSRADDRFLGWDHFLQAKVMPLSKTSAQVLIERADFDPELKHKFLLKFDDLYARHMDFLSNPLLAYMMLVTFSYNPDIPNKMFLFYDQAFEALYHRHDRTKGYNRRFHCALDKYNFIRLTSYFCLKTYYDEKIEFTRMELLEAIDSVKAIEGHEVDPEAFLEDLVQSVCLLKSEGLTYTFTHRSFQEYFAAYCMARVTTRKIDGLFNDFSKRHWDRVLPMVSDINPDLFREKFILPNRAKFVNFFEKDTNAGDVSQFAQQTGAKFVVRALEETLNTSSRRRSTKKTRHDHIINIELDGAMADFVNTVSAVSRNQGFNLEIDTKTSDDNFVAVAASALKTNVFTLKLDWSTGELVLSSSSDDLALSSAEEAALKSAFASSRMHLYLSRRKMQFIDYVNSEVGKYNRVSGAFVDLF